MDFMLPCTFSIKNHSMHYTRCSLSESLMFHYIYHWTDPQRLWIYLFYVIKKQKWLVVTQSIRLSSSRSLVRSNQLHFVNFFKNSVTRKIVTICLIWCLTGPLARNQYFHATRQRGKIQSVFPKQVPLFEYAESWNIVGVQRFWMYL